MQQIEYFPEREKPRARKGARSFEGFSLERGFNQVPDAIWEAVKDDPVIRLLTQWDAIKVTAIADRPVPTVTPAPATAKTARKPDTTTAS